MILRVRQSLTEDKFYVCEELNSSRHQSYIIVIFLIDQDIEWKTSDAYGTVVFSSGVVDREKASNVML